jgi:hypothetical protein
MIYAALLALFALMIHPVGAEAQDTALRQQQACDGGDLVNCSVLGLIYQTGAAGVRDLDRATRLYERACGREVVAACRRLAFLESDVERDTPSDERVRIGYVADAYDGAPLGGAIVRVRGIPGVGERRYVSDVEGRVLLDPLPRGGHDVDVTRGGYARTEGVLPVPWDGDFLILMEEVAEEVSVSTGSIFGHITTQGTESGISDVDVVVTGSARARAISNRDGRFLLADLPPGRVELRLERLGYEPRSVTVTVRRGRTLELYATMAVEPIDLEPVQVTVASRRLERSGFYARMRSVSGDRFTYREIEEMSPIDVADIVRRVGGVSVIATQIGFGSEAVSNRRRGADDGAGRCRLRPYHDGAPLVDYNLEVVAPDEIEAMEIYQGAEVPVQFLDDRPRSGPSCGVILIWTRDPRRPL